MDSLTTQKPKSRKIKKITKKSRVQIILDLFFRAVEIIVVLVTIAKLCNEVIIAFEDSGLAKVILANRRLAFVVGNAIVIALIAKSGVFLNQEVDPKSKSNALIAKSSVFLNQEANPKCKSNNLYDEYVRESSKRNKVKEIEAETETTQNINETRPKQSEAEKESETENIAKQIISDKTEKKTKQSKHEKKTKQSIVEITMKKTEKQSLTEKKQSYRRSKSENLEGLEKSSSCGRLKRSETERFDSDDELRYKIESFIARQRRNQNDDE
ncbi:hypothetical protein AALP_AA7G269600 [Arabis alpina]|uniref:DUF4408 domain-containing protein n=1 Tax=Arabis alpina TaxID=50452 RepID=A0A087GKU6_ARAAL|nr:hypothetical protein AALP_AA7G269600 [Arabis alpina]